MAQITAAMVNELRQRTGGGIMECKKALQEANGDLTLAEDIIAKSGNRKAAKSASRTAAEGRIVIVQSENGAAMLEVNCETDFVAREETFITFAQKVADIALQKETTTLENLLAASFEGDLSVEEARQNIVAKIGENIQIRRLVHFKAAANQCLGGYVHNARMGGLVLTEGGDKALAKDMAMQLVANKAQFIKPEDVTPEVIAKEKDILTERAKQTDKPQDIAEKIVAGQMKKYLDEICLVGQPFFKDPDQSVATLLKKAGASVKNMCRFEVGEGIEVIKKSFEEEVMSQARGNRT